MFVGRYAVAIITIALAGSFVAKKIVPVSDGTLRITARSSLSGSCLWCLSSVHSRILPALALGPVVEYLTMIAGGLIHV